MKPSLATLEQNSNLTDEVILERKRSCHNYTKEFLKNFENLVDSDSTRTIYHFHHPKIGGIIMNNLMTGNAFVAG